MKKIFLDPKTLDEQEAPNANITTYICAGCGEEFPFQGYKKPQVCSGCATVEKGDHHEYDEGKAWEQVERDMYEEAISLNNFE